MESPTSPHKAPKMKKTKKKRRSHAPSAYNLFIKAHYDSVRYHKKVQERMKALGKLWRQHKENGKKSATKPAAKK